MTTPSESKCPNPECVRGMIPDARDSNYMSKCFDNCHVCRKCGEHELAHCTCSVRLCSRTAHHPFVPQAIPPQVSETKCGTECNAHSCDCGPALTSEKTGGTDADPFAFEVTAYNRGLKDGLSAHAEEVKELKEKASEMVSCLEYLQEDTGLILPQRVWAYVRSLKSALSKIGAHK